MKEQKLKKDGTPDMRGRHGKHAKSESHPKWKPGSQVSKRGYVWLRVGKAHPLANPNGYAPEHTVVWCAAGNPRPSEGYVLHHINGNRTDNRIENLELVKSSIHMAGHMKAGNPSAKLSFEQVAEIRRMYDSGQHTTRLLAKKFEVNILVIQRIVSGKTYTNGETVEPESE